VEARAEETKAEAEEVEARAEETKAEAEEVEARAEETKAEADKRSSRRKRHWRWGLFFRFSFFLSMFGLRVFRLPARLGGHTVVYIYGCDP